MQYIIKKDFFQICSATRQKQKKSMNDLGDKLIETIWNADDPWLHLCRKTHSLAQSTKHRAQGTELSVSVRVSVRKQIEYARSRFASRSFSEGWLSHSLSFALKIFPFYLLSWTPFKYLLCNCCCNVNIGFWLSFANPVSGRSSAKIKNMTIAKITASNRLILKLPFPEIPNW